MLDNSFKSYRICSNLIKYNDIITNIELIYWGISMKTKHIFLSVLAIVILLLFSPSVMAQPNITGDAAILVDAETGKVLWGLNERDQRAPASITKLVTALVAIESADNLQDKVTISGEAVYTIPSIIWLHEGEIKTLEDLIYAMMLISANDAALAVAEHIGGTVGEFVEMMNQRVRELGAYNTNFVNPTGLSDQGHHSTAYDIALIMRVALENPTLRGIMGTQNRAWDGLGWQGNIRNTNDLLMQYDGTIGGKTGNTTEAGRCLVNAVNRDGMTLISVVLGSTQQNIWNDSIRILNYGYDNYHMLKLVGEGDEILQIDRDGRLVPVLAGQVGEYLVSKNLEVLPTSQITIHNFNLPLRKGDTIGTLEFLIDGEIIESVELVAGANIRRSITWVGVYVVTTLTLFGLIAFMLLLKAINAFRKRRNSIYANRPKRPKYGSTRMY